MAGIYIHIPFCKKACHYCDFHFSTSMKYKERMLRAIALELKERSQSYSDAVRSIYFGGGTPSLLTTEEIGDFLKLIRDHFEWESNPEITLECNPDDGSQSYFEGLRSVGVNRLSIGVQSFFDDDLKFLGRVHHAASAETCLKEVKAAGFDNITLDLIYGIPGSNQARILDNLSKCIQYDIPHISAYALTEEPNTVLSHWIRSGRQQELDDQFQNEQFYLIKDQLSAYQFEHYELSNYGRKGYRSVHNQNYWSRNRYLGIGPSAHSYSAGIRRWNVSNNAQYMREIEQGGIYYEEEKLDRYSIYNEKILVGLRRSQGINLKDIGAFRSHVIEQSAEFIERGWLTMENDQWMRSTEKGLIWLDHISQKLFAIED